MHLFKLQRYNHENSYEVKLSHPLIYPPAQNNIKSLHGSPFKVLWSATIMILDINLLTKTFTTCRQKGDSPGLGFYTKSNSHDWGFLMSVTHLHLWWIMCFKLKLSYLLQVTPYQIELGRQQSKHWYSRNAQYFLNRFTALACFLTQNTWGSWTLSC